MIRLFVGGLPSSISEIELLEMFSLHTVVCDICIIRENGKSKGFGFVHLENQIAADRVIHALNGIIIGNRTITVQVAEVKRAFNNKTAEARS
jgi:RNA recognition motif-containing protein